MNKKHLSVVMAGAMLATSVAPVLAATPSYEVNGSNKGLLIRDLRNLLKSKVFANETVNNQNGSDYRGQSVYAIEIERNGRVNENDKFFKVDENSIKKLEEAIKSASSKDNAKVHVYDRGHVEKNGKNYAFALETIYKETQYTKATLAKAEEDFNDSLKEVQYKGQTYKVSEDYPSISSMTYKDGALTVVTRRAESETTTKTIVLKEGDKALDFKKPLDEKNDLIDGRLWSDEWNDLNGYKLSEVESIVKGTDLEKVELAVVSISNADEVIDFKLSDLYDGLLLTTKGQELLDGAKKCKADANDGLEYKVGAVNREANGLFTLTINFYDQNPTTNKKVKKVVKITTNNEEQLTLFRKWMIDAKAQVEVLAGEDRYETAVKIAKENASIKDVAKNGNIVLVNGNSLVDGLAAAPLAASAWNKNYNSGNPLTEQKTAPILLTKTDEIPKATKDYIKELIKEQKVGNLNKVTIYLVGGNGVISNSIERQLKDFDLRVVRAGGEDREETSLKVAEVMAKDGKADLSNAFVVGAKGEADAMSIAAVAAEKKQPIIVESFGGLSEKAIDTMKNDWKNDNVVKTTSATIVGGDAVVSEATVKALKEAKMSVDRISGSDRKETNAEVMNRFAHNGLRRVVVSKDGIGNKSELIDALTATSLAVKHHAPIVLGTNSLTNSQVNAIEKKAQRTGIYVYQVGYGVSRDVLKTLAERVGLAK